MRTWITIALALGAAVATALVVGSGAEAPEQEPDDDMAHDPKPKPLHVGVRGDPELEALLTELDDELRSAGVRDFSAAELTKMRKTPGPSYAVPPRSYWPRMIATMQLVQRIRDDWGKPIKVYNGYRPADYNAAVGGKSGSRHQWNEAVDLLPEGDRDDFAFLVATYYVREGAEQNMGFGVYGKPGRLTGVHVDTHRKRRWGSAQYYIDRAAAQS